MYKKLVLIICLLFGVGSTFAYNVGLVKQACSQYCINRIINEITLLTK